MAYNTALVEYDDLGIEIVKLRSLKAVSAVASRRLVAGAGQLRTGDVSVKGLVLFCGLLLFNRLGKRSPVVLCVDSEGVHSRRARGLVLWIGCLSSWTSLRDRDSYLSASEAGAPATKFFEAANLVFAASALDVGGARPSMSKPTVLDHSSPLRSYVSVPQLVEITRPLGYAIPELSIIFQSHDRRAKFDDGLIAKV